MSEKFRSLELLLLLVQAKSKAKKKSYPDAFGTCECRKVLPTMHCSSKNHEVILKNCASAPLRENNTVNPVVRRLPVCQCTKGHHPPDPKTSRALAKTNFSLIRFITQRLYCLSPINPGCYPGLLLFRPFRPVYFFLFYPIVKFTLFPNPISTNLYKVDS